jgi:hypothetical protein
MKKEIQRSIGRLCLMNMLAVVGDKIIHFLLDIFPERGVRAKGLNEHVGMMEPFLLGCLEELICEGVVRAEKEGCGFDILLRLRL